MTPGIFYNISPPKGEKKCIILLPLLGTQRRTDYRSGIRTYSIKRGYGHPYISVNRDIPDGNPGVFPRERRGGALERDETFGVI